MGYGVKRLFEILLSATSVVMAKALYGPSSIRGPFFCFGAGLNVSIRKGGKFIYGKVSARRNLSVVCDGGTVLLANGVFFNNGCSLNALEEISVGENTLFGEGVKIYDHNHTVAPGGMISRTEFSTSPVRIGGNCWIGSNVVILKGVCICDGVIIGAGSVVSRSIDRPGVYVSQAMAALQLVR